MKVKTFPRGGVHPPGNRIPTLGPVQVCPLPKEAVVFLTQHLGAPAEAMVEARSKVKVGSLLGRAQGLISANVHSPVSGTVKRIDKRTDASGYPKLAVIISVEGDEWEEGLDPGIPGPMQFQDPEDGVEQDATKAEDRGWKRYPLKSDIPEDPELIREAMTRAGIVGMGGAGFPTTVKYLIPPGKTADYLIINGVECEPYLAADHGILLDAAEEILIGAEALRRALGAENCVIGIELNKADAIEIMSQAVKAWPQIRIQPLEVKYPQGAEKQLIHALTGREVPSGQLPLDVGCVVNNVATSYAVYCALQHGLPLIERIVTVTGAVRYPGNYLVRVGTPLSMLLEQAGGSIGEPGKIILGGPMMGKAVASPEVPVTKTTSGILVLSEAEAARREAGPCIRCSRCVSSCPMGLEPYILSELARLGRFEEAEARGIADCVECGSCSYICPASRELTDWIRLGKARVLEDRRKRRAS